MEKAPKFYKEDIADEAHDVLKYRKQAKQDSSHKSTLNQLSSEEGGHKKKLIAIVKEYKKK